MKKTQEYLLRYIEEEENNEEIFENLTNLFKEQNIYSNRLDLKTLLHILNRISKHHHRTTDFFGKIERVFLIFKEKIKNFFTNSEIFTIFKSNKRILLFLFEENIIVMDEYVFKKIEKFKYCIAKYPIYFSPEIKPFINENWFPKYDKNDVFHTNAWVEEIKEDLPDDFYSKRKIGENDNFICQLIRKDLIEDFIIYVNQNTYPLDSIINRSKYETNNFLLKKHKITLIEYATFCGSIQIFNYLRFNNVKLTSSLWEYAVHGQSAEIIHLLEELHIEPINLDKKNNFFEQIFIESIKCHHIDIANYIRNNYLQDKNENSNDALINCIKYYNFILMENDLIDQSSFFYLCKYDYYFLAVCLLNELSIDINKITIYN